MRAFLAAAVWLCAAAPSWAAGQRLIVGFKPDVADEERAAVLAGAGMRAVEQLDLLGAVIAQGPARAEGAAPAAVGLAADPKVLLVEEDFYADWLKEAAAPPLPPLSQVMSTLPRFVKTDGSQGEVPWGVARMRARDAWSSTRGAGVRVAVIDTGIDCSHPDLGPNCAGGYDATGSGSFSDDNGHGTHVAGTIGAVEDGRGVVGMAPEARLYAVKVLDKKGRGWLSSIVKGILWTAENGVQVGNMSLGSARGSLFMRMALMYANSKGVVFVAAAGNTGGSVSYPGAYPEAIAVAASDSNDGIAKFSSRGPQVEFIAPGVDVQSTVPGGGYARYSGTSMASPHVAGLAALAVSRGARDADQVREVLRAASVPVGGLSSEEQGGGMIDASRLFP